MKNPEILAQGRRLIFLEEVVTLHGLHHCTAQMHRCICAEKKSGAKIGKKYQLLGHLGFSFKFPYTGGPNFQAEYQCNNQMRLNK